MKVTVNLSGKDTVYITTEESPREGGISFVMFREGTGENVKDYVGFDGSQKYYDSCLKIADIMLETV